MTNDYQNTENDYQNIGNDSLFFKFAGYILSFSGSAGPPNTPKRNTENCLLTDGNKQNNSRPDLDGYYFLQGPAKADDYTRVLCAGCHNFC